MNWLLAVAESRFRRVFIATMIAGITHAQFSHGATSPSSDAKDTVWTAPKGIALHCQDQLIPFHFEGTFNGFNPRDAFWLMWMALRTHVSEEESTKEEMARIGYTRYQSLSYERTSTQGFVTSNGKQTVIAFRGSTDWVDWVADFSFRTIEGGKLNLGGKVHAGFAKVIEGVWPQILSAISTVGGTQQQIWVTGHSLGGAMATLTAIKLAKLGYSVAPVYTFGAPRQGNEDHIAEVKAWLGGKHYRILNGQDLVPRVPPTVDGAMDFGFIIPPKLREWAVKNLIGSLNYLHSGDMVWFDDSQKAWYMADMDRTEDALFWGRIAQLARDEGMEAMLRKVAQRQGDLHSEKTYACLLRNLYFEASRNPESFTVPVSSKERIRTL